MPSSSFQEYLENFRPVRKEENERRGRLSIPSIKRDSTLSIDLDFIQRTIEEIYKLIESDLTKNTFTLSKFSDFIKKIKHLEDKFIFYCEALDSPSIERKPIISNKEGQQLFSEFLQHLFIYITEHIEDKFYINKLMKKLLSRYASNLFFSSVKNNRIEVTLWIDPLSKETALIAAISFTDPENTSQLINLLKSAFNEDIAAPSPDLIFSPEFERYFFHENNEGMSIITTIWKRADPEISSCLLEFAKKFYGRPEMLAFQHFIFQLDPNGSTALIRACERGNYNSVHLILNGIQSTYKDLQNDALQQLLIYKDKKGANAVNKSSQQGNLLILKLLLNTANQVLSDNNSDNFISFLTNLDDKGASPLISATTAGHGKTLKLLCKTILQASTQREDQDNIPILEHLLHQDNEGFTTLMRAAEENQPEISKYLLDLFTSATSETLKSILRLKTSDGRTLFHIAAQNSATETLSILLVRLYHTFSQEEFLLLVSMTDNQGLSSLGRIALEEDNLNKKLAAEARVATADEQIKRSKRVRVANQFFVYDIEPSLRNVFPSSRQIALKQWRRIKFLSIFCIRPSRLKRSILIGRCDSHAKDYQGSLPEDTQQLRKEAVTNLIAFLKQTNLASIEQIAFIRNKDLISERERDELQNYQLAIEQYHEQYVSQALTHLKETTESSLENALNRINLNKLSYILVDNGKDLLIFNTKHLFSGTLFSPSKSMPLRPQLTRAELKNWLDTYFSGDYTLHYFDPLTLENYPAPLTNLPSPILSDEKFLSKKIEGLSRKTIQSLFTIEASNIQLTDFITKDFFLTYAGKIGFRVEKFHSVYPMLDSSEKMSLQKLFKIKNLPTNAYEGTLTLTKEEKRYFDYYGNQITRLLIHSDNTQPIEAEQLLDATIHSYEESLTAPEHEKIPASEKERLIQSLQQLKTKCRLLADYHGKIFAQLSVFLLPSFIRSIANEDPLAFGVNLGLLGSDTLLRQLLINLSKHPQALRLFSSELGSKLLGSLGKVGERVPVLGSAFAAYGLLESGQALVTTDKQDPNRPYYAHLFLNNLATVNLMAADVAIALPFWPVLGLFALFTIDQLVTEGRRIHDNVLHLQDDKGHPLSKFYTDLKLGLGVVSGEIKLVKEQRELFKVFLAYLDQIQSTGKNNYPLITVMLPEVRSTQQIRTPVQKYTQQVICKNNPSLHKDAPTDYPDSPLCEQTKLVVNQKNNYYFELGKIESICEKDDAYYLGDDTQHNYTLLAGTWVSTASQDLQTTCETGQAKVREGVAKASGKAGAAIILNKSALKQNSTQNYTLFVPIDPNQASHCSVDLYPNHNPRYQLSALSRPSHLLACSGRSIYDCVDKIVVVLAPIYSIAPNRNNLSLKVNHHESENITHATCQEIQYLLTRTEDIQIAGNRIPKKTFAFFDVNHYLNFTNEGSILKSDNGFEAVLNNTSILIFEFGKTAYVQGTLQANKEQVIIISHLKGIDQDKPAILNATASSRTITSLGQHTQFQYKDQHLIILGNSSEPLVNVYVASDMPPLYYLTQPLNYIGFNFAEQHTVSVGIALGVPPMTEVVNLFMKSNQTAPINPVFSGYYRVNNEILHMKITTRNDRNQEWGCVLEIDASTRNTIEPLDLVEIQRHSFPRVSILTRESDQLKLTHYFFYQDKTSFQLTGRFTGYQLVEDIDNWTLKLQHPKDSEETQILLSEKANEITIQGIRYQINFLFASLMALDTTDHSPIDGNYLLAPIKIDKAWNETIITQHTNIYTVNNISIKNPTNKISIQFDDVELSIAFLAYQIKLSSITREDPISYSHHQAKKPSVEIRHPLILNEKNRWKTLVPTLLGAAGILITGLGTLFIKRFRRSGPSTIKGITTTLPLLEIQPTDAALEPTYKYPKEKHQKISVNDFSEKSPYHYPLPYLLTGNEKPNYQSSKKDTSHSRYKIPHESSYPVNLDQQLILAYWIGQWGRKLFSRSSTQKKGVDSVKKGAPYSRPKTSHTYPFFNPISLAHKEPTLIEEKINITLISQNL